MRLCPFCHSPEIRVISHDWFTSGVVLHCLDCDEIALVEDEGFQDEPEDSESDESSADQT
jgi:hypothetical protein